VPALTPITHVTAGSGSSWTVDNSQTAGSSGSPLTMIAYAVYDVPQTNHVADTTGVPSFCAGDQCLVLKLFNETSTGAVNDVIASNVTGGAGFGPGGAPNCTPTIITCAPMFLIDAGVNLPMVATAYPGEMENCAGCSSTTSGLPGSTASKTTLMSVRSELATNCCGQYGPKETVGAIPYVGAMFQPFNAYGDGGGGASCGSPMACHRHRR
jgi:hypothetical protein